MVKAQRVRSPRLPGGSGIVAARGAAIELATAGPPSGGSGPQPAVAFSYRGGLLLLNAHLYLIYWGAAWATSASPSAS